MTAQDQIVELLEQRLHAHIAAIYPHANARELISKLLEAFWPDDTSPQTPRAADSSSLSPRDAVVITCASSDNLGRLSGVSFGGSGSSLIEFMRFQFGGAIAA